MKHFCFLLSMLLLFLFSSAQEKKDSILLEFPEGSVEIPAQFPGGNHLWILYLERNLNRELGYKYLTIPKGEKFAKQTVTVLFDIDRNGKTTNITVENSNSVHPELAKEGIRVIAASPLWSPARKGGKTVPDKRKQKLSFVSGSFH